MRNSIRWFLSLPPLSRLRASLCVVDACAGHSSHLQLREYAARSSLTDSVPRATTSTGPPAFVFDIDGVLTRGNTVLAAARKAMQQLTVDHGAAWKYPVCFLTNGGGVSEANKAQQLSEWLHVEVQADQVVLSHTPMRDLAGSLADVPVLISGRKDVLSVARGYGFGKVLSTLQLGQAYPSSTPFSSYPPAAPGQQPQQHQHQQHQHQQHQQPQPAVCPVRDLGYGTADDPIAAVLVMADPSDWYRDLQLVLDVVLAKGVPSRRTAPDDAPPVKLYFSNPDLLWANEFPRPRLGQGAFSTALNVLHLQMTGQPLQHAVWYGKPNAEPYRLAEQLLLRQAGRMLGGAGTAPSSASEAFSSIFMVGDNPASDIRGANRAGPPWVPVLVRTGVYQEWERQLRQDEVPHVVVDDVLGAVQAGLHRHRQAKWHEFR